MLPKNINNNATTIMPVPNLDWDAVYQWSCDAFRPYQISDATIHSIADTVLEQTGGNPLFARTLMRYLEHEHVYSDWPLDENTIEWIEQRIPQHGGMEALVAAILQQHQRDPEVRILLETVAAVEECGGGGDSDGGLLPLSWIDPVVGFSAANALQTALHCGLLVVEVSESSLSATAVHGRIQFLRPESQVAVYGAIPELERPRLHLNIGRKIYEHCYFLDHNKMDDNDVEDEDPEIQRAMLSVMSNQLWKGARSVTDAEELSAIARINLEVGQKAIRFSDFHAAASHFESAISILGEHLWTEQQYDISLALHNCGAEAQYCVGDFDKMDSLLNAVFLHAATFQDKLQAYTVQVYTSGARHHLKEAVDAALKVLDELQEPIPANPGKLAVLVEYLRTRSLLRGKKDRFFLSLPAATNTDKIAAIQMLNFLCIYSYVAKPERGAMAVLRILRLTFQYGMTGPSVPAFSSYGFLLCALVGRIDEGYRYGQLSLPLLDQSELKAWLPRIYFYVYGLTNRWINPLRESLDPLLFAYRSALHTGDIEGSVITATSYTITMFYTGKPIEWMEQQARYFCRTMDKLGQTLGLLFVIPRWSFICELSGKPGVPLLLSGDVTDCESAMKLARKDGNNLAMFLHYIHRTTFYCFCAKYEESLEMAATARKHGFHTDYGLCFYEGMSALAMARNSTRKERRNFLSIGRSAANLFKKWAVSCPANFQNKHALLEAELAAIHGQWEKAVAMFKVSILAAKTEKFLHEEALAHERFAQYHSWRDKVIVAKSCFENARDTYRRWGAEAFALRMEKHLDDQMNTSLKPEESCPNTLRSV